VESEPYMKYIATPLEGHNELTDFVDLIFGNCFLEIDHMFFQAQPSPVPSDTKLELLHYTSIISNEFCSIDVHSNNSIGTGLVVDNIWTLYFDS